MSYGECQELAGLREENARLREALEGILVNVSLDWYVQNFSRNEESTAINSELMVRLHNRETLDRIKLPCPRSTEQYVRKNRSLFCPNLPRVM